MNRKKIPKLNSAMLLLAWLITSLSVIGQVSFDASGLAGESSNNPTSLQFGPDGRLYVSQQNGNIYAYTVIRNGEDDYEVTNTELIQLVKNIPNHDDEDGAVNGEENNRQVTGIYVTGTADNPKLYVSSSDPRIGAGGGGNDEGLDTNSGMLSCVTCIGGIVNGQCEQWDKIDLVRGLPRSEENHATNGIQVDEINNILYLAVGGHTNAGAPSNNFAFTVEYTFSACIISVDLDAIDLLLTQGTGNTKYKYDLPTLDDPTRPNVNGIDDPKLPGYTGEDPNDPFGGNDGLNMAKIDPTGPVQIFASGFRNLYDIVIREDGKMYGVDNGANGNWGGHPENEADYPTEATTANVTNNYLNGEPGSTNNNPGPGGDDPVNNKNGLHYIRELVPGDFNYVQPGEIYYGGHPAPIRGNPGTPMDFVNDDYPYTPGGANLYALGAGGPGSIPYRTEILDPSDPDFADESLPVDWPPVPPSMANPAEGDFRQSGQDDNALANYNPSTNGLTEYTASNFDGALQGVLLLAAFNGNIYQVELSADGKVATNCPTPPQNGTGTVSSCTSSFASGFGSQPLDVIAQGDNDPFPGTVWAVTYGADNITIFEPNDFGNCEGTDDDTIDEDNDGYTNADEIDNGTNPCSGASQPIDNDDVVEFNGFKRSDLNDPDDDNDGILDVNDPFCLDPDNGFGEYGALPIRLDLFNSEGYGFGSIGFPGIMVNGTQDYFGLIEDSGDELIYGGTAGLYTDPSVGEGDAFENVNTQKNGFQFPVTVNSNTGPFTILGQINGSFFNGSAPQNFASHGIFMGTGDQDNYVKLTLRNNSGNVAFQVLFEDDGVNTSNQLVDVASSLLNEAAIELYFAVDPAAGTVQASYAPVGGTRANLGNPITLSGDLLDAVQGNYTIGGQPSALAVGTIATSTGDSPEFNADWDFFDVTVDPSPTTALVEVNTGGLNGSTFGNSSFNITNTASNGASITNVTFDLSSAVLPEIVFDPNGTAGDATFKGFTPNSGTDVTTGVSGHNFTNAYEGGFYGLSIDFTSGQFTLNETLQFGLDIDPVSIKGGSAPGPNESGSVSGLELTGAKVLVTFSTGDIWEVELFGDVSSGDGNSNVIVQNALPETPTLEMLGVTNQSVTPSANQTISVSGPVGATVRLFQFEAGIFIDGLDGPNAANGYNVDPWEINSIIGINELTANVSTSFSAEFNVTLTDTDDEAGYNVFVAVIEDENGVTSDISNIILVEYDASAGPTEEIRINAGGADYTDGNGDLWSADQFFVNGSAFPAGGPSGNPIANTTDDFLYQTERFNANLQYEIPVTGTGPYEVNLLFAELFFGAPGNGSDGGDGDRVFDVIIEGNTVLSSYDIHAEVGALAAVIKSFSNVNVADGILNISFPASVNNGKISAIEVLGFGATGNVPISLTPIANQTNLEGTEATIDVAATGGDGNLQYSATGLPTGLDIEPTNGDIIGTIAVGASLGGPNSDGIFEVTITVDDSDGDNTDAQTLIFSWTVLPATGAGQILYRVNAGGPEVASADGTTPAWGQDQGVFGTANNSPYLAASTATGGTFSGNSANAHPGPIITTDPSLTEFTGIDPIIFNTERWDAAALPEMLWQFPVPVGTDVEITLLFAELFGEVTGASQRVFSVSVDGEIPTVFTDLDPYAIAGPKGAFVRSFTTTSDGVIDLELLHGIADNPAIKGIQITSLNTNGNLPPVATNPGTQNSVEGGTVSLQIQATDDDNCGAFTYAATNLPDGLSIDENTGVISGTLTQGTGGGGVDGAFIEENGLVLIETETDFVETPSGWNLETGTPTFLVASTNHFGNTNGQTLTYNVQITTPGVYRFNMKSEFQGSISTEENDSWFKIDNTTDVHFFCVEGGALTGTQQFLDILNGTNTAKILYYPAGNALGRPDHGNENPGNSGFFKSFRGGNQGNKWQASTIDNNGFPIYAYFPNAGTFSLQMSERSAGHKVDKITLYHIDDVATGVPSATLDNAAQSEQVEGGTAGASAGSPYSVQVQVSDDCDPPASTFVTFDWLVSPGQTGTGTAFIEVNPGGGLGASTFGNNSFHIQNTGSVDITRVEFETTSGHMFDIVFDPVGTAGDQTAKCVTTGGNGNTAAEVGLTIPGNGGTGTDVDCIDPFFNPHNGSSNAEGYDGLALDFTDFNPGENYWFGADMDPTTIKGDLTAGNSGSVSGLEIIGAKVTVFFANGTSYAAALWDEGSLGGSHVDIAENTLTPPTISVVGLTTPTVTNVASQTIAISGTPNATVELFRADAHLYIDPGNPSIGYDVDPFEANSVMAKELYTVTLDGNGDATVAVTLTKTVGTGGAPDGGINQFIAVETGTGNQVSEASNVVIVEFDPNAVSQADLTINATLEGQVTPDYSGDYSVKLYEVGEDQTPTYDLTATADALGDMTVTGITPGTYQVAVKFSNSLQTVQTLTLNAGTNSVSMGELTMGDGVSSNNIDIFDFSLLRLEFGTQASASDFDGDGDVDIFDFSRLRLNFGLVGQDPTSN
ncbi:MAG: malectin domain-containing carbohydrate-binding protein [Bacteroidota bacterium]